MGSFRISGRNVNLALVADAAFLYNIRDSCSERYQTSLLFFIPFVLTMDTLSLHFEDEKQVEATEQPSDFKHNHPGWLAVRVGYGLRLICIYYRIRVGESKSSQRSFYRMPDKMGEQHASTMVARSRSTKKRFLDRDPLLRIVSYPIVPFK